MDFIGQVADCTCKLLSFQRLPSKIKRLGEVLERKESNIKIVLDCDDGCSLRRRDVEIWLKAVHNTKDKFQQTCEDFEVTRWFEVLKLQKTWENVNELVMDVEELTQKSAFIEGLTIGARDHNRILLGLKEIVGEMFEKNKNNILEWLWDDDVLKIGICGTGGIGKTTLAKYIHNQLQSDPDILVSWVIVSKNFSIYKLQDDIARTIRLNFSKEDDVKIRAGLLAAALRKLKKSIIILDDVCEFIWFENVGIPEGLNSCKLILTTRLLNLCRAMGCEKNIKMKPLSKEEGRQLFKNNFRHCEILSTQTEEITNLVADECAGLALGIIIISRNMIGADLHKWLNCLRKMRESRAMEEDLGTEVFHVLKCSYDMLWDSTLQQCLLYCALYPEDFKIDKEVLIEYFIDEGLVGRTDNRQAEIDEGHYLLSSLKDACLLEGGINEFGKEYVKMHPMVRDMAIQITRVGPKFLVQARKALTDIPKGDKWDEDLVRVSLMCNEIVDIPCMSPTFPRHSSIETLLLSENFQLNSISNCFLMHMKRLKILDLSDTSIKDLPDSISDLTSLVSLLLRRCWRLNDVPPLVKLKALRRLDLYKTGIIEVPRGLESLVELRYLNLATRTLKMIPPRVLSKLRHLQYLVIHEFESFTSQLKGEEIAKLRELETFKEEFGTIDDLNIYIKSRGVDRPGCYLLHVVEDRKDLISPLLEDSINSCERVVSLRHCTISDRRARGDPLVLPRDMELLHIKCCEDVTCLCHVTYFKETTCLKTFIIEWCSQVKHVLCSSANSHSFRKLESLCLKNLLNLCSLIERKRDALHFFRVPNGTFFYLKEISVVNCPKVKILFTPALFFNLQNLEKMSVISCEKIVGLIGDSFVEDENQVQTSTIIYTLPKLRDLKLVGLPKLESVGNNGILVVFNCLECIRIVDCPKLRIPLPSSLQKIQVQKKWWESLECEQLNGKYVVMKKLQVLITGCSLWCQYNISATFCFVRKHG